MAARARYRQCYGRIGNCEQSKRSFGRRSSSVVICTGIRSGTSAVKPHFTDTRLIRTPRYITDSLLCSWGKKAPTFSLNSTSLIRTPTMASSVSVLTGCDCTGSIETHCACNQHFRIEIACVIERSNDITEAILVFLNKKLAAMLRSKQFL